MKKFLSLLLAAMMILSVMPVTALADGMKALDMAPIGEVSTPAEEPTQPEEPAQPEQPAEKPAQEPEEPTVESGSGENPENLTTAPMLANVEIAHYRGTNARTLKMTPEFATDTKEYTVVAECGQYALYVKVDFAAEFANAKAVCEYTNAWDDNESTELANGAFTSLSVPLDSGSTKGTTLKITVTSNDDNNYTEVYTFNVVRSAVLSRTKIVDGSDPTKVINTPGMGMSLYNYSNIFVEKHQTVSITTDVKPTGAAYEIVGAVDGAFTPTWNNGKCDMLINVSAEGAETTTYTFELFEIPTLEIVSPLAKSEYDSGDKLDLTGLVVKAVYTGMEETLDLTGSDVKIAPEGRLSGETENITITYKKAVLEVPVKVNGYKFKGSGTQDDPYLLENAEDCVGLSREVSTGKTFAKTYFKITADITLPEGWVPIGGPKDGKAFTPTLPGVNFNYFAGYIDGKNPKGGNFLLTVPKGEKTLLGCVMGGGKLSNLDIYGERIDGYGVMEYYVVSASYGTPCMDIDNVNLKSGTHTKMSGFLGGYASGTNVVNITNCTVEEGVVIGDDGSWGDELNEEYMYMFVGKVQYNDMVGSFGGGFNGSIRNSKSYATVYGRNYVGGFIGFKGQSMGDCTVENCEFGGKVIASGNYAGGIIGSGYSAGSAPNTPLVIIQNCLVSGSVTGADNVGGVLGGNEKAKACWNNGIGYIRGNLVTGTVSATSANATVGAIVGHLCATNLYNIIKNNYYVEGAAANGIGAVDTKNDTTVYFEAEAVSNADLTNGSVVKKLNSAKAGVSPWKQGESSPVLSGNNRVYKISLMGLNGMRPITVQSTKAYEALTASNYKLTAYYNDGTTAAGHVIDGVIMEPDYTKNGVQLCSVIYDGYEHFFGIEVKVNGEPANQSTKAVKFRMLGDTVHEVTASNVHTYAKGNLVEWIPEVTVRVPADATAYDVFVKAANAFGVSFAESDTEYGKYVSSVTKDGVTLDAECNKQSNGVAYCGWMFNINDNDVYTSLDKTEIKEGDVLNFYFEDDYSLAYVKSAIDAINAIPDESAADYDEKVKAAEDSLKYLSPIALEEVMADPAYAKLVRARNRAEAKKVEDMIFALQPVTKDSGDAIKAARDAYEALTPEQKDLVSKDALDALEKAEKQYSMIVDSNKPDASDKGDKTNGSIIKISATGAANGEQNPNTGAPEMSIAPAMLVLAAAALVLKKRG